MIFRIGKGSQSSAATFYYAEVSASKRWYGTGQFHASNGIIKSRPHYFDSLGKIAKMVGVVYAQGFCAGAMVHTNKANN